MNEDELAQRILFLVPDAKVLIWKDEGKDDKKGYDEVYKIDGLYVAWTKQNAGKMPSEEDIKKVNLADAEAKFKENVKKARNKDKTYDLGLVGAYLLEKKSNPALLFSDFVDSVEAAAKNMQDNMLN